VVLADTQDNPGAGGNGDTTGLLAALLARRAPGAVLGLLIDPASAAQAHVVGVGRKAIFTLGEISGVPGHKPLGGEFSVLALGDAAYAEAGYAPGLPHGLGADGAAGKDGVRSHWPRKCRPTIRKVPPSRRAQTRRICAEKLGPLAPTSADPRKCWSRGLGRRRSDFLEAPVLIPGQPLGPAFGRLDASSLVSHAALSSR
jgi:hypothetical protein